MDMVHNDLKPSNVVISAEWDIVLIDFSGVGVTREWMSPEMRDRDDPHVQNIEVRKRNDVWVFGKMLSIMADASGSGEETELLKSVAQVVMQLPTPSSLRMVIPRFSGRRTR